MSDDKRTIRHLKRVIEALQNDIKRLTIDKERMALKLAEERARVYNEAEKHKYTTRSATRTIELKRKPVGRAYKG